jgi:hypothetical protein
MRHGIHGTKFPSSLGSYIDTNRDVEQFEDEPRTVVAKFRVEGLHSSWNELVEQEAPGDDTNFVLRLNASNGLVRYTYRNSADTIWHSYESTSVAVSAGDYGDVAFSFVPGDGGSARMFIDGVKVAGGWVSGDGQDPPITAAGSTTVIGNNKSRLDQGFKGDMFFVGIFGRLWDEGDAKLFHNNPWQVFEPSVHTIPNELVTPGVPSGATYYRRHLGYVG